MQDTNKFKDNNAKYMGLIQEFARYLLVGGTAFLVDTGILYLTQRTIFYNMGETGVLISTALGFTAGLIYNYILSIIFVFRKTSNRVKSGDVKPFLIFTIIGVIGLGITEGGMYLGIRLFGLSYYLIIKVFIAVIVLFWNYIGRKVFIFK
jgi:putative flippase GtrA